MLCIIMSSPKEIPSPQVLSLAVGGSAGLSGPPASPTPPHRIYKCVLKPAQTTCIQLKTPTEIYVTEDVSRLVLIPSWIPSIFDKPVVRYTLWSDHKTTITSAR